MFEGHEICGSELLALDDLDLVALGVRSLGHRKRLLNEIQQLRTSVPSLSASLAGQRETSDGSVPKQRLRQERHTIV